MSQRLFFSLPSVTFNVNQFGLKKRYCYLIYFHILLAKCRGVAQPGSALAWGARGRRFKSFRPDQSQSRARKQAGNLKPQNIFHGYTSGYTFQYSRDK